LRRDDVDRRPLFSRLILGLMRDGQRRHGYELMVEYRNRAGIHVSAGNFYRELPRLMEQGLVQTVVNPPDADPRRIPYVITEKGRQVFDRWLSSPIEDGELPTWILFADRLPHDVRERLLERRQEDLWLRGKQLAREREDAVSDRHDRETPDRYDPLPMLFAKQIKQNAAELEFLKEFREEFDEWQLRNRRTYDRRAEEAGAPSLETRRQKGTRRK
jgi:DNA-binding PadR family transcriptional regulator